MNQASYLRCHPNLTKDCQLYAYVKKIVAQILNLETYNSFHFDF